MLILGTLRLWKDLPVDPSDPSKKARLFIEAIHPRVRAVIFQDIEHLRESDNEAWVNAMAVRFGQAAIRAWDGIGHCDENGVLQPAECTPENIRELMTGPYAGRIFDLIHEVGLNFVQQVDEAGNVSRAASSGTEAAAQMPQTSSETSERKSDRKTTNRRSNGKA